MNIIIGKRGVSLCRRHLPTIYQELNNFYDIPCEIYLGDLNDFKPNPKPVLYYWVRTDEQFYYIGYVFYHPKDYTNFIPGKPFDEHLHDLESILLQTPYYLPNCKPKSSAKIITVYHHELKTESYDDEAKPCVVISAGGHGISPCEPMDLSNSSNYFLTQSFKIINIDSLGETWFETMKTEFNKHSVHMPDQWSHNGKYEGWMWTNPDDLFKVMFSEA
jgi:hypothetical protein